MIDELIEDRVGPPIKSSTRDVKQIQIAVCKGFIPELMNLGALAVLLATINVSGGFIITKRMLDMFKRKFEIYYFE